MGFTELFLTALGLSMDAFAVAICKGLAIKKATARHYLTVALWFGAFQAGMPLIGYYLGSAFRRFIVNYDHWIAFVLLVLIGGNMVFESLTGKEDGADASVSAKAMFPLAVATSIDALAVGVTLAMLAEVAIVPSVALIGVLTAAVSAVGLKIGNVFGVRFKAHAERVGGVILILIGTKILFEHLGILTF